GLDAGLPGITLPDAIPTDPEAEQDRRG
ncbi:MAG: hypothetical protein QOG99_2175, partial [Frankiales bacterium]|nr:hypothetical protein [Frankiales bacterium]